MIKVFFRACDSVPAVNGFPRPFGMTKTELVKACFKSLHKELPEDAHLTVIADNCSAELLDFFKEYQIQSLLIVNLGPHESAKLQYKLAKEVDDTDIVYFVEDDYFHFPKSISAQIDWINNTKSWIHPTDYPDRYTRVDDLKTRWLIGLSKYCHWRQIANTTCTFMAPAERLKKHLDFFIECGIDDGRISSVFKSEPLFSPIPTLAVHMHEGTIPFGVNMEKLKEMMK